MNNYVALLRGVNVGGRVLKMDALTEIFKSLKFKNVKTFIQSGNVIFGTKGENPDQLRNKIEKKLQDYLGYEVKVMLRSAEEMNNVVENNPFKNEEPDEDIRIFIAFSYEKPDKDFKAAVASLNNKNENYIVMDNEIYCRIRRDEKTGGFWGVIRIEKKLGIPFTTRNQNTVSKINQMLKELE